jgi:hypothetical protein
VNSTYFGLDVESSVSLDFAPVVSTPLSYGMDGKPAAGYLQGSHTSSPAVDDLPSFDLGFDDSESDASEGCAPVLNMAPLPSIGSAKATDLSSTNVINMLSLSVL